MQGLPRLGKEVMMLGKNSTGAKNMQIWQETGFIPPDLGGHISQSTDLSMGQGLRGVCPEQIW